jgi:hypothetical protein
MQHGFSVQANEHIVLGDKLHLPRQGVAGKTRDCDLHLQSYNDEKQTRQAISDSAGNNQAQYKERMRTCGSDRRN